MLKKIKEKLNKQMGQTFIEYILISALIGLVLVGVSGELIKGAKTNFYYGLLPTNEQRIDLPIPPEGVPPVGSKPPTAIINGPTVIHIGNTATFTDNSTDSDGRIVRTSWGSSTVQKQYIEEGSFSITLTVWDNVGLTDTTTFEFTVENKAPIAFIETSPSNSILWKEEMSVSAIKSSDPDNDKIIDWQWYLDSQEVDWEYDGHTQKFQEGSHTIGLKVMDIFGKWSSLTTTPIEIKPNSKPVAIIDYTPKNKIDDKTNINWSSNSSYDPDADKIISVEWKLDGVVKSNPNGQLSTGNHTISLRVQDEWGLWSDWKETTITVESSNQPPIAIITVTPEQGPYYTSTVFTWDYRNSTDADGDQIVNAEWSNKQETYAIGTYTIGLRVKDSRGLWSEWVYKSITIQDSIWYTFNYTGHYETWIAPATGKYKIELWGAEGGASAVAGGKGGYIYGEVTLTAGTNLYLYVGQKGISTNNQNGGSGGWNGGGNGTNGSGWWGGGGGGGASDIRIHGTSLTNRIIVAGGGGGTSGNAPGEVGGSGGGWTGSTGSGNNAGTGGTQSQGGYPNGSLGSGGNGRWLSCDGGAGGGGGYYGGGSGIGICGTDGGAGGGSSYASPIFSNTSTQSGVRTGNGSIRIKYIGN